MHRTRLPFLLPVAALGLAASATAASASTLCVGTQPAGTSCTTQYPFTATGLGDAFTAANVSPAADDVRVAAGTLSGLSPKVLGSGGDALLGAGRSQTILKFTADSGALLTIGNGGPASVKNLTVEGSGITSNGSVLTIGGGGLVEDVAIHERTVANASSIWAAVLQSGSVLRDSSIDVNSANDIGASLTSGAATIEGTTISGAGAMGIQISSAGAMQLRRLRISGVATGIGSDFGPFTLDDSVIDLGAQANAVGISARNFNNSSGTIAPTLRRVTIVGSGNAQVGVWANADNAGETVTTSITGSLLRVSGTGAKDIRCGAAGLAGTSSLTTANTGYGALDVSTPTCPHTATANVNLAATPPKFVSAATGDYRPMYDSPVIDRGTNTAPGSIIDLGGAARLVDGDGTGGTLTDLGAYEYQRQAPAAPTSTTIPAAGAIGEVLGFSASGATDPDADPVSYAWDFGDGAAATGPSATHAYAADGTYTVSVRATDPTGRQSSPITATVTVPSADQPQADANATPTPTPTPAPEAPAAKPAAKLVAAPKGAVKRTKAGFTIAGKPVRTNATLELTATTEVRLTLTRLTVGHRAGTACKAAAKHGKRCTIRTALAGSSTLSAVPGTRAIAFGGTFAGKRLPAGSYEAKVTPLGTGGAAGKALIYRITLR